MRLLFAAALAAVIAGCATGHRVDRGLMSDFQMLSSDEWVMTAKTAISYPESSERAEAIRVSWIEQHAQANGCDGVEVTSRQWTKGTSSAVDSVGTLRYTGKCLR